MTIGRALRDRERDRLYLLAAFFNCYSPLDTRYDHGNGIPIPIGNPMGIPWEWELVTQLGMGMGMGRNGNHPVWEWEWPLFPWE